MTKRLLTASVTPGGGAVKRAVGADSDTRALSLTPPDEVPGLLWDVPVLPDTTRRLLAAAVAAFAEHGFHGTTTRDIATRAGLSPAGLYVHYPSKAALLGHLSSLGHEAAADLVDRSLAPDGSAPAVRLHRMVAAFVAWHAEHHQVARVVQYELRSLDEGTRALIIRVRRRMEDQVEAVVEQGAADGSLDVTDARQAARVLLSLAVDVSRWFDPDGRQTPDELGRAYADLAMRMVGARPVGGDLR
jgi:AcrR family transcriptional regulator